MQQSNRCAKFAEFWHWATAINPNLGDEKVKMTLTVGEFKRQMERAFESGARSAPEPSLFDKIFGSRR